MNLPQSLSTGFWVALGVIAALAVWGLASKAL